MSIHNRNPHRQDVSAVDERRKKETIFPSSATMISAGFSSNVRRRVLQIPLRDETLTFGYTLAAIRLPSILADIIK